MTILEHDLKRQIARNQQAMTRADFYIGIGLFRDGEPFSACRTPEQRRGWYAAFDVQFDRFGG